MIRIERCVGFGVAALALAGLGAGCGGGGSGGGGGSPGGSFANIQSSIASPTGTVDETTAADVGAEFEKVSSSGVSAGMRRDAQVGQSTQTLACDQGGSMTSSGSGNESSGQVTARYDNCCMIEDCCTDGVANIYFSSDQTASYSFCGSYDVSYSCEGVNADLTFNGCFGSTGEWVYVVEVDGESYAVTGSYLNGSGELEITGANGTWTCTYTNDGGSCTGTSGNFEF